MFRAYNTEDFGAHVRGIRKSLNMTQKDVETTAGISCETLRKLESGLVIPKFETLEYLSHAYRVDLLKEFSTYRTSYQLFSFYTFIDNIIVENDSGKIHSLVELFNKQIDDEIRTELINYVEFDQMKLIVQGIEQYYSEENQIACMSAWLKAIRLTLPEFKIESCDSYNYNQLEQRICVLLSLASSKIKDYLSANKLLLKCLDEIESRSRLDLNEKIIMIKIHFNLSYNYHCLDENVLTLAHAEQGILLCQQYHINYLLPGLLFRRGICKYNMSEPDFQIDILHSITLLKILNNEKLANIYKNVAFEKYGISLSN